MLTTLVLSTLALATPMPQDGPSYFAVLAETRGMRMAGLELVKDIPRGMNMPGMEMMTGEFLRVLNIRLWTPSIAPNDAKATVKPPAGLKKGDKLELELYRPGTTPRRKPGRDEIDPDQNPEAFTIKIYWGSSETVREGQPKIIRWADLSPEHKAAMRNQANEMSEAEDYFYKEGWTTGYWPTKKQKGDIAKDASLVGLFDLTTTYAGNVSIEAPSDVNFLAGFAISEPNLEKKLDLKKALTFKWAAIPNVLGQYASAVGIEGKNTMVIWSSSEVYTDALTGEMDFMQMADVRENVAKTVFMKPDTATVSIPIGIFANADVAMLTMVGYGPGAARAEVNPIPRIQTKSSLMVILGGKKVELD